MTQIEMLIIAILAILGALLAAGKAWLDSGEPFDARKFGSSAIRGIIAALVMAMTTLIDPDAPATVLNYIGAFIAGAGFDYLLQLRPTVKGIKKKLGR